MKSQPELEFQKEIGLESPSDIIAQAVLIIRTNYHIVMNSEVIRILNTFDAVNIKKFVIYFFVSLPDGQYKVYAVTVEYNSQITGSPYKVISIVLVIETGIIVNTTISTTENPEVSIAYGFEPVNIADASNDETISMIEREIKVKYQSTLRGQSIREIEKLELKNGKVNYKIRYDNVYFIVYYDTLLQRVLLLNAITSHTNTQYNPVNKIATNSNYKLALQQLISQHTAELKDYTVISTGQATNATHYIYQIELFAQGHKYRAIVIVNMDTMEVYEQSWNEMMEIDLKHINYMQVFVEEYQKLSLAELKTNEDFVMVDRYIHNQNPVILKDATVLGAAYKPQNLGFNFKVFYIVVGQIYSVEVYIESFSGKINQLAFSNLDFSNNFVAIKAEGG